MKKGKAGYCLGTLSADQWRRIWDYACAHDWCMTKGNQHENIFQVCSAARIAIRPNLSARGGGDILAELLAETSEAGIRQKLKIYWCPGYCTADQNCMDHFDNRIKWKADFTKEWLEKQLLPRTEKQSVRFWRRRT